MTPRTYAVYGAGFLAVAIVLAFFVINGDFTTIGAVLAVIAAVMFLVLGVATFVARRILIRANRRNPQ